MDLQTKLHEILLCERMDRKTIQKLYQDVLRTNALSILENGERDENMRAVEEFLLHALYLQKIGVEDDYSIRIQIEAAHAILYHGNENNEQEE